LPSFYFCQVGLPNCWRPIFLVLPKLYGCQVGLPNFWSCSKKVGAEVKARLDSTPRRSDCRQQHCGRRACATATGHVRVRRPQASGSRQALGCDGVHEGLSASASSNATTAGPAVPRAGNTDVLVGENDLRKLCPRPTRLTVSARTQLRLHKGVLAVLV
jgi:hypothetical protein